MYSQGGMVLVEALRVVVVNEVHVVKTLKWKELTLT